MLFRSLETSIVEQVLGVVVLVAQNAQPIAVGTRELVQVAAVPASERIIDRRGKLRKGMATRRGEHASRSRPQGLTVSSDQFDANREPGLAGDRLGVPAQEVNVNTDGVSLTNCTNQRGTVP